ncbi:MAG: arylsulfatase [Bacteroidota bacterium]
MINPRFSNRFWVAFGACVFGLASCLSPSEPEETSPSEAIAPPNVVLIYIDDLGYGDLGCYGAQGVKTPYVDLMAQNGLVFTDGHCSAATCTPSRYSLLTGQYAFRNRAAVLQGDAPLIISPDQATLPKQLKTAGYATAVIGKWHLGLGNGDLDWNQRIAPGPLEVGFDECFLIPATGDRVPTVYVENHQVLNLDPVDPISVSYKDPIPGVRTGQSHPQLLRYPADPQHSQTIVNGVSRIGYMKGGDAARWMDEDFPFILNDRALDFIRRHQKQPFFLFYSFHDIHVPRLPNPQFQGESEMGPRGDAIVQMDWMTGQIMKELDTLGLAENTLLIFTSDNGPVLGDGYGDQAEELLGDHQPAGPYRGGKYSAYEGGTRVPTIAYWPGRVKPGKSQALVSQVDLLATLSELAGATVEAEDRLDSQPFVATWLGDSSEGREQVIEESYTLALRQGNWKYIRPRTSQGFTWIKENKHIEGGLDPQPQLYDLAEDPGEANNLADRYPERVEQMEESLQNLVEAGKK